MDLSSFIKLINTLDKPEFLVLQFIANEYLYLFASNIATMFKKDKSCTLSFLDTSKLSVDEIIAKLSIGFLGQRIIYWVKDFSLLSDSTKNSLIKYFQTCSGPNGVIFFDSANKLKLENEQKISVDLLPPITAYQYQELYKLFYPEFTQSYLFSKKTFEANPKISLEVGCALMFYDSCLGRNSDIFFKKWFSKIAPSDKSLFALSGFLLDRDKRQFFGQWFKYKGDYPEEFWIVYFSELIWQAIIFINKANKQGIIDAKRTAYRLPFSFMNKSWKQYDIQFLISSYQELYKLDYGFKNGVPRYGLDLWLFKFFPA